MRRSSLRSFVACALLFGARSAAPATAPAPAWAVHREPGFSVEAPPGWTAAADRQKGWVHLMGTQGEDVVVWPVFLPDGPATLDLRTAQFIHKSLASASPYSAEWESATARGPNIVSARGKIGEMKAVSAFAWKASPRGVLGYFYSAGAREIDFGRKAAELAKVLQSFRLTGWQAGSAGGGLQYVPFADPVEGAFVAEVPAGWKVGGGMARSSPDDPHPVVEAVSPDGQIKVALGDAELPTYFLEYPGGSPFPEGSRNGPATVMRYLTGAWYSRYYVSLRAPMVCTDLQITNMQDSPELVQLALSKDPTLSQRPFSIGSVSFQCRERGQLKAGFCQSLTVRLSLPIGSQVGMWRVHGQWGYFAAPEQAEQAKTVMNHLVESIRFSTQWGMQEVQNAGVRSRIISGASQQIADMAASSQRYRDAVDDRIARMRSDATLGIVRVSDPATGRQTVVDSGSNYYWVDPRGVIVGTDVDTNPGVDFRRLVELPPQ